MVSLMTRIYPCGECAEHFASIVRDHAPTTETGPQLRQWMCKAHNAVNQSLGKPQFNCQFVDARWGGVECEGETACVLFGGPKGR
ncbi:g4907 [Coccomyxa viridis]|uniref:Sulfhydryl oxidase n=1 Tax=Coccomyxa viridis TaxID=1274662 RepID=A0ABP1FWL6_9CHLO